MIYVSSPDFFGKLENARFDSSEDAETLLRTASAADLLILDDLGTEFVTPLLHHHFLQPAESTAWEPVCPPSSPPTLRMAPCWKSDTPKRSPAAFPPLSPACLRARTSGA